jgi:hypothetical protein
MPESFASNLINVAFNHLQHLKIDIAQKKLKQFPQEHPGYTILYSLSSIKIRLNVPSKAFSVTYKQADRIVPFYIAYLKNRCFENNFVLVPELKDVINFLARKGDC